MPTKPFLFLVVTWSIIAAPMAFADAWRNCSGDDAGLSTRSCSKVIKEDSRAKHPLAEAYYNCGTSYEEKNKLDFAIADFGKAIELDPHYKEAYLNRGSCYDGKGDYASAIADDSHAIELEPRFINAIDNRAQAYDSLGQYSQAIVDYTRVIELDPKYGDVSRYYVRGLSRYYDGDFNGAAADFAESLRAETNPNAMLHQKPHSRLQVHSACRAHRLELWQHGRLVNAIDEIFHRLIPMGSDVYQRRVRPTSAPYKDIVRWLDEVSTPERYRSSRWAGKIANRVSNSACAVFRFDLSLGRNCRVEGHPLGLPRYLMKTINIFGEPPHARVPQSSRGQHLLGIRISNVGCWPKRNGSSCPLLKFQCSPPHMQRSTTARILAGVLLSPAKTPGWVRSPGVRGAREVDVLTVSTSPAHGATSG